MTMEKDTSNRIIGLEFPNEYRRDEDLDNPFRIPLYVKPAASFINVDGVNKPIYELELQNRGGVSYQWQITPIKWGGIVYDNIYTALVIICKRKGIEQNIPFRVLQNLLQMSDIDFLDLLNEPTASKRHIKTNLELKYRIHEKSRKSKDDLFFLMNDDKEIILNNSSMTNSAPVLEESLAYSVHILTFEAWAKENEDLLPENRYGSTAIKAAQVKISELQSENNKLKNQLQESLHAIDELKNQIALGTSNSETATLWGLPAYIMEEKRKGATCFEVAKHLREKYNFSKATIGALMHPQGDIFDWNQYGKLLLNEHTEKTLW